jgi:hypothetical protein
MKFAADGAFENKAANDQNFNETQRIYSHDNFRLLILPNIFMI